MDNSILPLIIFYTIVLIEGLIFTFWKSRQSLKKPQYYLIFMVSSAASAFVWFLLSQFLLHFYTESSQSDLVATVMTAGFIPAFILFLIQPRLKTLNADYSAFFGGLTTSLAAFCLLLNASPILVYSLQ